MNRPDSLLIGGEWVAAESGGAFETLDPSTGKVLGAVADGTAADAHDAVSAAEQAFAADEWRGLSPAARGRLLFRLADLLDEHVDELAQLETQDQGQPTWAARMGITEAAEHCRYFGGWATKICGSSSPLSVPEVIQRTVREPLGVCALITPWNFPLQIAVWKLAPALATGNTVVLKPAEQTPLTTLRLGQLTIEAGFPPGVVNIVTGGPDLGRALVSDPRVAKISFTGSTEVGREIAATAGQRLARVSLELGGKTPSIITASADLDEAVAGNAGGGLFNSGQTCAAFSRLYVHRSRHDEFAERLSEHVSGLVMGCGLDAATQIGPLVSEQHRNRVRGYVEQGLAQGAEQVAGGDGTLVPGHEGGYFMAPTIFTGVTDEMTIVKEEIFGPVLSILSYDDESEVIARANDSDFGLAAVVWSREINEANRMANALDAGTVWINSVPALDVGSPWGGMKQSGIGREMGWEAVLAYTDVKAVITSVR